MPTYKDSANYIYIDRIALELSAVEGTVLYLQWVVAMVYIWVMAWVEERCED